VKTPFDMNFIIGPRAPRVKRRQRFLKTRAPSVLQCVCRRPPVRRPFYGQPRLSRIPQA
jgi:hypothetical protein